jgi:hypothetical protein
MSLRRRLSLQDTANPALYLFILSQPVGSTRVPSVLDTNAVSLLAKLLLLSANNQASTLAYNDIVQTVRPRSRLATRRSLPHLTNVPLLSPLPALSTSPESTPDACLL